MSTDCSASGDRRKGIEGLHQIRSGVLEILCGAIHEAVKDFSVHEPQIVANLTWQIPSKINSEIDSITKDLGVKVRVGSVFVHKTPRVKPTTSSFPDGGPKSVEIGDVLFVVTRKYGDGREDRSALLLQAKKNAGGELKPDNKSQHHLYAFWPEFKYLAPNLADKNRHVTGPHLYNGAKYLFIVKAASFIPIPYCLFKGCAELGFEDNACISAQPSLPALSRFDCFAEELFDLIVGNAGRAFIYKPDEFNTNWDQVVTDLIDVTAGRFCSEIEAASEGKVKERGIMCCFVAGDSLSVLKADLELSRLRVDAEGAPPKVPDRSESSDDESDNIGISIVEFIVEEMPLV